MNTPTFEVLDPGLGATIQDRGRPGWKRFGVPPSGVMDRHASGWANRLLGNPPGAPTLELLLQGAKLQTLEACWIVVTGADAAANVPLWRVLRVSARDILSFPENQSGVWTYLAVEGGFESPSLLGSSSTYARGGLGQSCEAGTLLCRSPGSSFELEPFVAGRFLHPAERRDYSAIPRLRVWPGPQMDAFGPADLKRFFAQSWTVTARSDRMGYRLSGEPLEPEQRSILSEPVLTGTIQTPPDGFPIVTMRDGPTVGGYPKLGILDPEDVSWLAQARPGSAVTFQQIE
jgi:biotin-dependent carboxylase-like uncharacterized protein